MKHRLAFLVILLVSTAPAYAAHNVDGYGGYQCTAYDDGDTELSITRKYFKLYTKGDLLNPGSTSILQLRPRNGACTEQPVHVSERNDAPADKPSTHQIHDDPHCGDHTKGWWDYHLPTPRTAVPNQQPASSGVAFSLQMTLANHVQISVSLVNESTTQAQWRIDAICVKSSSPPF